MNRLTIAACVLLVALLVLLVFNKWWRLGPEDSLATVARNTMAKTIAPALEDFRAKHGRYPSSVEGLKTIEIESADGDRADGTSFPVSLIDPWKRPYQYRYPSEEDHSRFALWSHGPSLKDSADDIVYGANQ
jgi:general secretion pathway protein G